MAHAPFSLPCLALALMLAVPPAAAQSDGVAAPKDLASAAPSALRPDTGLTLAQALQLIEQQHPELAAARHEVLASQAAREQAGAWPNPTLAVQLEDQRRRTRTSTVTLEQVFELGGKRAARTAAADRATDLARGQWQAQRAELRAQVVSAFFTALVAQERVQLAQQSLALAQRGSEAASKRSRAGKVSPIEVSKAELAESSVQLELLQAQAELRSSLDLLQGRLGSVTPIRALSGRALDLPALPSVPALMAQTAQAPAVRVAQLEVQRAQALAQVERARRVPDLTLTVGATRETEQARNQAVLGLSLPLPLFDRNRGNLEEALRRQDKAEDLARAAELRVRSQSLAARQRLDSALQAQHALKSRVLPAATSTYDAMVKGFELGKFSGLEVLDAQRTLLQSRAQFLQAVAAAHAAHGELQQLLGEPSEWGAAPLPGEPVPPTPSPISTPLTTQERP